MLSATCLLQWTYFVSRFQPALSRQNPHSGTHRGADENTLNVLPFHGVGLHVVDVVNKGLDVLLQLGGIEADLADHGVYDPTRIVAELDLARLVLADCLGD